MFADETLSDVPVDHLIQTDCFLNLPQPALAFDLQGQLVAYNRAAAVLHGIRPSDTAKGPSLAQFFPTDATFQLTRAIGAVRTRGEWRGILAITAADNVPRIAEFGLAKIGERIIATYTDVTDRALVPTEPREVTRWEAIRKNVKAFWMEMPSPMPQWVHDAIHFCSAAEPAFDSVIDQGAGRTVLLVGFGPVMQQILTAFLERCHYLTVEVEHPSYAKDVLAHHKDWVRTAVLGPNATPDTLADLHRVRPLLPVVTLGWESNEETNLPVAVPPTVFVRAVAEAVGTDHLNDVLSECEFNFPDFTVS
jgi:hypothetical protein